MQRQRKKVRHASKPELLIEYMEDSTNAANIISCPKALLSSPSSSTESHQSCQNTSIFLASKNFSAKKPPRAEKNPQYRKYSIGSVYHQAKRFASCISSSTNISSSLSGSVEVIISEIDNPCESLKNSNHLSPLGQISENNSEESEEKVIKNIIDRHRSLNNSRSSHDELILNKSMKKMQEKIFKMKKEKEMQKLQVRLQILQGLQSKGPVEKSKDFRSSY